MVKINFAGVVMLLLCLNILLYVGGVRVIEDGSSVAMETTIMDGFANINTNDLRETGGINVSDDMKDSTPTEFQESGIGTALSFVDALKAVKNFIKFIVNIVFAPIGLFAGLPSYFTLMLGVPLIVAAFFGIIYFIRSGN